jgi:hypothetical protein
MDTISQIAFIRIAKLRIFAHMLLPEITDGGNDLKEVPQAHCSGLWWLELLRLPTTLDCAGKLEQGRAEQSGVEWFSLAG